MIFMSAVIKNKFLSRTTLIDNWKSNEPKRLKSRKYATGNAWSNERLRNRKLKYYSHVNLYNLLIFAKVVTKSNFNSRKPRTIEINYRLRDNHNRGNFWKKSKRLGLGKLLSCSFDWSKIDSD